MIRARRPLDALRAALLVATVAVPDLAWGQGSPPTPPSPPPREVLGTIFPPLTLSTRTDVWWTAPRAPLAVAFGASGSGGSRSAQAVGRWMAQGSLRHFSLDVMLHTPQASHREERPVAPGTFVATGTTAWVGIRLPIFEAEDEDTSFGVYARGGIPVDDEARGRSDLGLAFGGVPFTGLKLTWLLNFGSRQRIGSYVESSAEMVNPYLLVGPTWNVTDDVRLFALGSLQALVIGMIPEGFPTGNHVARLEFAAHAHPGAEVRVGPLVLSSSFAFAAVRRAREPWVSAQIWVGYAP